MGAGEVQVVAQQLGELRPRRDGGLVRLMVDGEVDRLHVTSCDTFSRWTHPTLEWNRLTSGARYCGFPSCASVKALNRPGNPETTLVESLGGKGR